MEIENKTNVFSENRGTVIFVIILAVIVVILLGVLYFVKQRNLGEGTPGAMVEKRIQDKKTLAEIIELTSAPEKNPNIKPNPALTALTSAPESSIHAKTDPELMDKLTAPKN
jgi:hypothetical protein